MMRSRASGFFLRASPSLWQSTDDRLYWRLGQLPSGMKMKEFPPREWATEGWKKGPLVTRPAETGPEPARRMDGSAAVYWQPEIDYDSLPGWKAHIKWEKHVVDPESVDVLPERVHPKLDGVVEDLRLLPWERQVLEGRRNPVQKNISPERRHHRSYKVHEFPAGRFIEWCGNLVRLNYKPIIWYPNKAMDNNGWKLPLIYEYHPMCAINAIVGEGPWGKFKDLFADLLALGFRAWWAKIWGLRKVWWKKEGKVLIGIDRFGNKYWEFARAHTFQNTRCVEFASGHHRSTNGDIPMEWYLWVRYVSGNPPNDPSKAPIWMEEYWHSRDRWQMQLRENFPKGSLYVYGNTQYRKYGETGYLHSTYSWDPEHPQGGETHRHDQDHVMTRHTWIW